MVDDVFMYEIGSDDFDYDGRFWLQYSGPAPRPPERMQLGPSLAWAREHGSRIRIRVGNTEYSAGSEPIEGLPVWDDALELRPRHHYEPPGPPHAAYRVRVHGGERSPLPESLAALLSRVPGVLSVTDAGARRIDCVVASDVGPVDGALREAMFEGDSFDGAWSVEVLGPAADDAATRALLEGVLDEELARYVETLRRLGG